MKQTTILSIYIVTFLITEIFFYFVLSNMHHVALKYQRSEARVRPVEGKSFHDEALRK